MSGKYIITSFVLLLNSSGTNSLETSYRDPQTEETIILITALFSILIIIFSRLYYNVSVKEILKSILGASATTQQPTFSEDNSNKKGANVFFIILFFISIVTTVYAYFVFLYPKDYSNFANPYSLFGFIAIAIGSLYIIKIFLALFLAFILKSYSVLIEYLNSIFSYLKVAGLLLIPIYMFIPYVDKRIAITLVFVAIAIVLTSFLFRIIKVFSISFSKKFSIHHAILYFCIFEIIPVLIFLEYFNRLL